MTPAEVGRRFTTKDIGQILAYERIVKREEKRLEREAELESKAKTARQGARAR